MAPRFLIIMGIAGCGKSTVAAALAAHLGWPFLEGDGLHPAVNIAKMSAGAALSDADRLPWLHAIAAHIGQWRDAGGHGVVTCSALRRSYRDILRAGPGDVHFVYLKAERALIVERFSARRGHFMPASLIDSQIATLQEPAPDEPVLTLSVTQKLPLLVAAAADLALIH
jgi:gluconokinase